MARPKTDRTAMLMKFMALHHDLGLNPSLAQLGRCMSCSTTMVDEAISQCIAGDRLERLSHGQRGTRANQYRILVRTISELERTKLLLRELVESMAVPVSADHAERTRFANALLAAQIEVES